MATVDQLYNQYMSSQAYQNQQRMQNATIQDIAKKYGFNFSRDYANQQAEAQAQAKRNAYNNSLRQNQAQYNQSLSQIDKNIRDSNQAIDHSFFQEILKQQQNQANNGLNAGIAADQNLRLGMNAQAQLADVYGQANLARQQATRDYGLEAQRLREALDLVEQQRLADAEKYYQDALMRGYDILMKERSYAASNAANEWARIADQVATALQQQQMAQQERLQQQQMALQERLAKLSSRAGRGSSSGASLDDLSAKLASLFAQYQNQKNPSGRSVVYRPSDAEKATMPSAYRTQRGAPAISIDSNDRIISLPRGNVPGQVVKVRNPIDPLGRLRR